MTFHKSVSKMKFFNSETLSCEPTKESDMNAATAPVHISVKQAADHIGISAWTLYKIIKEDTTFPALNVGRKKKYVVNRLKLEAWLERSERKAWRTDVAAPSTDELLERYGK